MDDELPQAVRVAMQAAAKRYVRRWIEEAGVSEGAQRTAIQELFQMLKNVYLASGKA